METPGYESDRERVVLYDRSAKTKTTITEDWERSPSNMVWATDSSKIYAVVNDEARMRIYSIALDGTPTCLVADHDNQVNSFWFQLSYTCRDLTSSSALITLLPFAYSLRHLCWLDQLIFT